MTFYTLSFLQFPCFKSLESRAFSHSGPTEWLPQRVRSAWGLPLLHLGPCAWRGAALGICATFILLLVILRLQASVAWVILCMPVHFTTHCGRLYKSF